MALARRARHGRVLALWTEAYARSLIEPDGAWSGFARQTVDDWLALLAGFPPEDDEVGRTLTLAVLRGAFLDLLATGDRVRVTWRWSAISRGDFPHLRATSHMVEPCEDTGTSAKWTRRRAARPQLGAAVVTAKPAMTLAPAGSSGSPPCRGLPWTGRRRRRARCAPRGRSCRQLADRGVAVGGGASRSPASTGRGRRVPRGVERLEVALPAAESRAAATTRC